MISSELIESVMDYFGIIDDNEVLLRMADVMGTEAFVGVIRNILVDRMSYPEEDYVDEIETIVEGCISDAASFVEGAGPGGDPDGMVGGMASLLVSDTYGDIVALEDLGFINDASKFALRVASALEAVVRVDRYDLEDLRESAKKIRADVEAGHPAEWFRTEFDEDDLDDEDDDF